MFKDIKVGDLILIETAVSGIGWTSEWYKLPFRVTKVTPTRFTAGKGGGVYTKKDGRLYGGDYSSGSAFIYDASKDQRKAYQALVTLKRTRREAIQAVGTLTNKLCKEMPLDQLNKIIQFCKELDNVS